MTLEEQIEQMSEVLSGMSDRSSHQNEWVKINDMHLTVCELKAQLNQLREIEKQNLNMEQRR